MNFEEIIKLLDEYGIVFDEEGFVKGREVILADILAFSHRVWRDKINIDDEAKKMNQTNEPVAMIALENTALKKIIEVYKDLLSSAYNIANRYGENTYWERFAGQLHVNGISPVTPKTFTILPSDTEYAQSAQPTPSQSVVDEPPVDNEHVANGCELFNMSLHNKNIAEITGYLDETLVRKADLYKAIDGFTKRWDGQIVDPIQIRSMIRRLPPANLNTKPTNDALDAERFYDLGFSQSGEGWNGEHGSDMSNEYYLNRRKEAIDRCNEKG